MIYTAWQDYEAAVAALARAMALGLDDPSARLQLGNAYMVLGKREEAIAEWREAGAGSYLLQEARRYLREGDYRRAEESARLAVAVQPDSTEAHRVLGDIYAEQGRAGEAISAYRSALQPGEEETFDWYITLARLVALQGEWEAAIDAYGRAAALQPEKAEPYYQAGWIAYSRLKDRERAIGWFQRGIRADPAHVWSYMAIGRIFGDSGECLEAGRWFQKALAAGGGAEVAAEAHFRVGACYQEEGRVEAALQELRQAVALFPRSVWYRRRLADLYLTREEYPNAATEYRRILELDPQNVYAREQLKKLGWSTP